MFKVRVQYISGAPTFAENLVPKQAYRIQTGAEYICPLTPLRYGLRTQSSKINFGGAKTFRKRSFDGEGV